MTNIVIYKNNDRVVQHICIGEAQYVKLTLCLYYGLCPERDEQLRKLLLDLKSSISVYITLY